MTLLVNRAPRLFTVEEYERLHELGIFGPEERVELIGGEIVPMAAQDPRHANAVSWCNNIFSEIFGRTHLVRIQLPITDGKHSEPEPDLTLLSKAAAKLVARHPKSVDLVLEVSNTTLLFDRREKLQVYAAAGFQEYWIVNLEDRLLEVYRQPSGARYLERIERKPGETQELLLLPGFPICVSTLLGEPPEA